MLFEKTQKYDTILTHTKENKNLVCFWTKDTPVAKVTLNYGIRLFSRPVFNQSNILFD